MKNVNPLRTILIGLLLALVLNLMACSSENIVFPVPSFVSRLTDGDRNVGWALTYYESWNRHHQPQYLLLAERYTLDAIDEYARLQEDTSPRINEFYVARERRVRSCRLLAEIQFSAANHGYNLRQTPVEGCVF